MVQINKIILTNNDCYKRGVKHKVRGLMWHSTGANNPELRRYIAPDDGVIGKNQYNNHWNQPGIAKCVHAFIGKDKYGKVRIYQTLPWDMVGWHSGTGSKGFNQNANNTGYIGFEICEDNLQDKKFFEEVYEAAIQLSVYLVKKFNIPIENIISHREGHLKGIASNHGDPDHWMSRYGKTMNDVRNEIKKRLNNSESPKQAYQIYRVRKTWEDASSQIGAFAVLENAKELVNKNPSYKVFDESGKVVYEIKKEQQKTSSKIYEVVKDIAGYYTANDAKNKKNKKTTVKKGKYYIYKEYDKEVINVSTKEGVAGSWINKTENITSSPTTKPQTPTNQPSKPKAILKVDGLWGSETTKALQRVLGTTVDGVISGQYKNGITTAIPSVEFGSGGSQVIRALQKKLGIKQDGYIGVETVRALQKYLGTPVDGVISKPSLMVKEMQRRLNEGKF